MSADWEFAKLYGKPNYQFAQSEELKKFRNNIRQYTDYQLGSAKYKLDVFVQELVKAKSLLESEKRKSWSWFAKKDYTDKIRIINKRIDELADIANAFDAEIARRESSPEARASARLYGGRKGSRSLKSRKSRPKSRKSSPKNKKRSLKRR